MGETDSSHRKWYKQKIKEVVAISCVGGLSVLGGFGYALSFSKKQDPKSFNEGLMTSAQLHEGGAQMAWRALRWGTLLAVSAFSFFCLSAWKTTGAKNMEEFRDIVGHTLPRISKRDVEEQDRTDFKTVREFVQYYIDKDEKEKGKKS